MHAASQLDSLDHATCIRVTRSASKYGEKQLPMHAPALSDLHRLAP